MVDYFSENRVGSLLVIERAHSLENVKETGWHWCGCLQRVASGIFMGIIHFMMELW